ncbi:MAG: SEC-C metal-binding domain-containing protein, partial [Planctomycetota bacterium]
PQRAAPQRTAAGAAFDVAKRRQAATAATQPAAKPKSAEPDLPEVGRNDPCPCGSGKKYKKCHGS